MSSGSSQRRRGAVVAVCVAAAIFAHASSAHAVPETTSPDPISTDQSGNGLAVPDLRGVEYSARTSGESLLLDVYQPTPGESPTPVVILVHGGGFTQGARGSMRAEATWVVEQGWTAVSIDYRLDDVPGYPGEVDDVRTAVSWVRSNAETLGIDPARIALYGVSAGGTLASGAAVESSGPLDSGERVVGVVSVSGPMDLTSLYEESGPRGAASVPVQKYLGCEPQACADLYVAASPTTYVTPDDPPHFLAQSTDEFIPVSQGQLMEEALRSAGVDVRLELIEGTDHAKSITRENDELKDQMRGFLQDQFDGKSSEVASVSTTAVAEESLETDTSVAGDEAVVDDPATDNLRSLRWILLGGLFLAGLVVAGYLSRKSRSKQ